MIDWKRISYIVGAVVLILGAIYIYLWQQNKTYENAYHFPKTYKYNKKVILRDVKYNIKGVVDGSLTLLPDGTTLLTAKSFDLEIIDNSKITETNKETSTPIFPPQPTAIVGVFYGENNPQLLLGIRVFVVYACGSIESDLKLSYIKYKLGLIYTF